MAMFSKTTEALDGITRGFCTGSMVIDAEEEIGAIKKAAHGVPPAMARLRELLDMPKSEGHTDAFVINEAVRHLKMAHSYDDHR